MDYSAYQQQQQQQQQQHQQQQAYSYEYDPSQIQAYDQSYAYQQPYYPYTQQYAYYPDPTQAHLQFQPESAPVHPPGVNPEPAPQRPTHAPGKKKAIAASFSQVSPCLALNKISGRNMW